MATRAYPINLRKVWLAQVNWEADTIKVLGLDENASFDPAHEFVASVAGDEIVASRPTVAGTVTDQAGNTRLSITVANTSLTGVTDNQTLNALAVYIEKTNDADSLLMFYVDGVDRATNGNNITITLDANGIYTHSY